MRKWNTILSVLMLLIFMIHGIMGSFMLNGVGSSAGKLLAWIGVGILVVHTVIGVILTVQSLQTAKQSGKMYLKQNAIFFVAAIFVHIFINIRPLLVSLGIISYKERRSDIYLILSVLLLFIAGAVILYYIGWQYL